MSSSSHVHPSWTALWRKWGGTAKTLVTWTQPKALLWWSTDKPSPWFCRQTCRTALWNWQRAAVLCSAVESHLYRRAEWWRWSRRNSRSWPSLLVRNFCWVIHVIPNAFISGTCAFPTMTRSHSVLSYGVIMMTWHAVIKKITVRENNYKIIKSTRCFA